MAYLPGTYPPLTIHHDAQTIRGKRTRHAILLRKTACQISRHRRQQTGTVAGQARTALPHTPLIATPTYLF